MGCMAAERSVTLRSPGLPDGPVLPDSQPLRSSIPAGKARIPLTQVFVLLQAVQRPPPRPLEQRSDLVALSDRMERAGLEAFSETAPGSVPVALSQALQQERHLVLLGEPGSGKTTTLQFIAVLPRMAGQDVVDCPGVPIRGSGGMGRGNFLI
jgi:hypothetical protein